jgi:hypothetical protein
MRSKEAPAQVGEVVQLVQDLPELGPSLRRGDVGQLCSTWFDPNTAFEVEFQPRPAGCRVRALLMRNQIQRTGHAAPPN